MTNYNSILDIKEILNDYSSEIQEAITDETIRVSKKVTKDLRKISPRNHRNNRHNGKYAKGWRIKKTKGYGYIKCIVHNSTDYQLTHLLEKGHILRRNGKTYGSSPAKVHIKPVHDNYCKEYEKNVEKIVKNGGNFQ